MEERLKRLAVLYKKVFESDKKDDEQYQELLFQVNDILDNMDEFITDYDRILFLSIAKDILGDTLTIDDKPTYEELLEKLANITYQVNNIDELISSLLLPRISTSYCMDNYFYMNHQELFNDFKTYLSRTKSVPARIRERVYSYMHYIAYVVLKEMESREIIPEDHDQYLLVWMLNQVLKSEDFKEANLRKNTYKELLKKRTEARYLTLKTRYY